MWSYFFILLLTFSAFFLLGLGFYGWRHRDAPGVSMFIVLMTSAFIAVVTTLFSIISPTPEAAIFWRVKVHPIGKVLLPVATLLFVLEYLGYTEWLNWRRGWFLWIVPAVSIIVSWVPNWLPFIIQVRSFVYEGFILVETVKMGPWLWVQVGFGSLLALFGLFVLGVHIVRAQYPYRQQLFLIFTGVLLSLITGILSRLGVFAAAFPVFDVTALNGTVVCAIFGWALFHYRLLDVVPIARDAVFDGMEEGVIVLDLQNRIVDINPAARNVLNVKRAEVVGQPIANYLVEQVDLVAHSTATASTTAEITLGKGGHTRIFDLRISTLYRQKHLTPVGYLIVLQDITARKQAEQALRQYAAELEASNAELDAYAHTVAHDLKNPIGVILGYAGWLADRFGETLSEAGMKLLEAIMRNSQKMSSIINGLLLLASVRKLDEIETEPLPMASIVEESLLRLAAMIDERQARVTLPAEDSWPVALGYAPWVEEIWTNYISNALKYGGTPPHIELGADVVLLEDTVRVRFWVKDNGPGLTKTEQAQLFTQFTRLHKVRATGHGLGLSIVQRIAAKLSGEVGVESASGQGSCFYFTLPAAN